MYRPVEQGSEGGRLSNETLRIVCVLPRSLAHTSMFLFPRVLVCWEMGCRRRTAAHCLLGCKTGYFGPHCSVRGRELLLFLLALAKVLTGFARRSFAFPLLAEATVASEQDGGSRFYVLAPRSLLSSCQGFGWSFWDGHDAMHAVSHARLGARGRAVQ